MGLPPPPPGPQRRAGGAPPGGGFGLGGGFGPPTKIPLNRPRLPPNRSALRPRTRWRGSRFFLFAALLSRQPSRQNGGTPLRYTLPLFYALRSWASRGLNSRGRRPCLESTGGETGRSGVPQRALRAHLFRSWYFRVRVVVSGGYCGPAAPRSVTVVGAGTPRASLRSE